MVGVPGKSSGCVNCRRRKIKCDATKPRCLRCERSSIQCEGYDRFPVFINRTQTGLTRRKRFEEAKPFATLRIPSFSSPDLEATRLIAWFWTSFSRSPPSRYALQSPSHWVDYFLKQYPNCLPLQSSLLAVATVKLSKAIGRSELLIEGRKLYAQSMTLTRGAIHCGKDALTDNIMATTCVMIMYELFDPTTESLWGWLHHLRGLSRLMECRGPKAHAHPGAHAIFEHSRYLLMIQHLLARKSSVFSRQDWLEEPWYSRHKSVEQQVFDQGLRLASVFEQCDAASETNNSPKQDTELLQGFLGVHDAIVDLHEKHIAPALEDESRDSGSSLNYEPLKNPAAELLSITALGIQLGACDSAHRLQRLGNDPCRDPVACTRFQFEPACYDPDRVAHLKSDCRILAHRIIRQTKKCLEEPLGGLGAARMIFSLRLAMQQFQPVDAEYEQGQLVLNQLLGKTSNFRPIISSDVSSVVTSRTDLVNDNANHIARQWVEYTGTSVNSEV